MVNLVNNCLSPLPFYSDISQQNHRKDYAFGQVYQLMTYKNMLIPFQAVLKSGTAVNWVRLYDLNTGAYKTVTTAFKENGIRVKQYADFSVLSYPATMPILDIVHEGQYYLAVNITGLGTIYSDVFCSSNNLDDYLLIEYSNHYNFQIKNGMVDFSDNFKFKCYLNTQVGKPEYDFEEEATERMGYSFIESQVSKKLYKFTALMPEYLCDALRIVRLCANRSIKSKGDTYDLITFSLEPKWEDQGDLAAVECEFETDTVIANIGGYEPELLGGDFLSGDFSDDFQGGLPGTVIISGYGSNMSDGVTSRIYLQLSEPARSALTVRVVGVAEGGGALSDEILIDKGETSGRSILFSTRINTNLTSASITSKGTEDNTKYVFNI